MAIPVQGGAARAQAETFSVTVSFSEVGRLHQNKGNLNE
jgi:hypothetical protein